MAEFEIHGELSDAAIEALAALLLKLTKDDACLVEAKVKDVPRTLLLEAGDMNWDEEEADD